MSVSLRMHSLHVFILLCYWCWHRKYLPRAKCECQSAVFRSHPRPHMYRTQSNAARRYGTRIISIHMSCQRRCRELTAFASAYPACVCPPLLILNTRMLMVLFWFARAALIMLSAKLFEASKSMRQQQRRIHVTFHCRTIIIIVVKRYRTWCHGE